MKIKGITTCKYHAVCDNDGVVLAIFCNDQDMEDFCESKREDYVDTTCQPLEDVKIMLSKPDELEVIYDDTLNTPGLDGGNP